VYIGRVETDRWTAPHSLNIFKYNILEVIDFSPHSGISYAGRVCLVLGVILKYMFTFSLRTFGSLCLSWGAKISSSLQIILFHFFFFVITSKIEHCKLSYAVGICDSARKKRVLEVTK